MARNPNVMFCTIQDVNDKIGKVGPTNNPVWVISSGGTIEPDTVERWISRRSGIINEEHKMNYQATTVTNEYQDIEGLPFIHTDYYPIISVTTLSVYNGSEYEEKTQGTDRNSDDFFIDNPKNGKIFFWEQPGSGKRYVRIDQYQYGYALSDIPDYVKECCVLMVAVDVVMRKEFQEECKEQIKKWMMQAEKWIAEYTELLNKHIRKKKITAKSLGTYHKYDAETDLGNMTL